MAATEAEDEAAAVGREFKEDDECDDEGDCVVERVGVGFAGGIFGEGRDGCKSEGSIQPVEGNDADDIDGLVDDDDDDDDVVDAGATVGDDAGADLFSSFDDDGAVSPRCLGRTSHRRKWIHRAPPE